MKFIENILNRPINYGLRALYHKEMRDHIRSRRMIIVLLVIFLTSFASLYGALTAIDTTSGNHDYLYLLLFTTSGSSIPSFLTFIARLGPFVGLSLGFDGIIGEKSERTLYRLTAQPIYRDSIINGKFLAGASIIFMMVYSMGVLVVAAGLLTTGLAPSGEELARIFVFLLFTGIYICFWLALSLFFSVICKNAATSAMAVIAIWLFLSLFMSMLAGIIADAMFPVTDTWEGVLNASSNYSCQLALNRISPYYLYSEAAATIMNPNIRTINLISMESLSGAITGYLPFGQSLLLVWPHLAGMTALMTAAFAGSYVSFMRQEIRS